jgi:hypothetical protein
MEDRGLLMSKRSEDGMQMHGPMPAPKACGGAGLPALFPAATLPIDGPRKTLTMRQV